jgi:hypothetical protein
MKLLSEAERSELELAWRSVPVIGSQEELALVGGVNLRLDVAAALKATFITVKLIAQGHALAATSGVGDWFGFGKDVFDLIVAALDATRQRLTRPEYTLCVLMAYQESPASAATLQQALELFLRGAEGHEFPFYVALDSRDIEDTLLYLKDTPNAIDTLLQMLKAGKLAEQRADGFWRYRPHHFTWTGISEGR